MKKLFIFILSGSTTCSAQTASDQKNTKKNFSKVLTTVYGIIVDKTNKAIANATGF